VLLATSARGLEPYALRHYSVYLRAYSSVRGFELLATSARGLELYALRHYSVYQLAREASETLTRFSPLNALQGTNCTSLDL
jgi:hypothetical protein